VIGLTIISGLIVVIYFATTLDITKADEEDKKIHLTNIPTPEQKADEREGYYEPSRSVQKCSRESWWQIYY